MLGFFIVSEEALGYRNASAHVIGFRRGQPSFGRALPGERHPRGFGCAPRVS
jgi:hypothetical protein